MNRRDDFSQNTKDSLCARVGGKCSNPNCGKDTTGPHSDPKKRVSIGQAAHITAAAEGGPRYNPKLTPEQRKSAENGIWLCNSCAKMIDDDEKQYPVELLKTWKYIAEYNQFCVINQINNRLIINEDCQSRKKTAYRELKKALDELHGILYYAYMYWFNNFKDRFSDNSLEHELSIHWVLYENVLSEINGFIERRASLLAIVSEYSLDLGVEICEEIKKYNSYLDFIYQADNIGLYSNYWVCFFDMLSSNFRQLDLTKEAIDTILHQNY